MKISIITVSYNSSETISKCIKSVNYQSFKNIEHVFIDGGSNDRTIEIIKKESKRKNKIISEKDDGIYDAMNKGIKLSSGDFILFLNSDDIFYSKNTVKSISSSLLKGYDVVYGDIIFVKKNKTVRTWNSGNINSKKINYGWHPPHPGLTVKKEVFKNIGAFDLKFNLSADYDFMQRLFRSKKYSIFYLREKLVKMSIGGKSTTIAGIVSGCFQIFRSHRKYGDNILKIIIIILLRYIKKINQ
ncbi:glycosyltransferase [Bacteroidota bacterium]|nr:glycosyltransferase [Bacteroidota bacterium]